MNLVDNEWASFLNTKSLSTSIEKPIINNVNIETQDIPKTLPLKISNKSYLNYLNHELDIQKLFWNLPVINFNNLTEGIISLQARIKCETSDQQKEYMENLNKTVRTNKYVAVKCAIKMNSDISYNKKYKEVNYVINGLTNNILLGNYPAKLFSNCIILYIRIKHNDTNEYHEYHIKIVNTGKFKITGITDESIIPVIIDKLLTQINTVMNYDKLSNSYIRFVKRELIHINSNTNCGYKLDKFKLRDIFNNTYNIQAKMQPNYPGIICEYNIEHYNRIKFIVFQTGSILIIGGTNKNIDNELVVQVYDMLCDIFIKEYNNIHCESIDDSHKTTQQYKHKNYYPLKQTIDNQSYLILNKVL